MEKAYLAARARNLKASRFLYRVDVVARVESEDDIAFWQKAIHTVRPNVKVKFIPAEVSESNERQRGKTLCMKLVPYLDEHLIICVDSDFDKFLRQELLTPSKHILQTHTYSWENHHCQYVNLQKRWEEIKNVSFDFSPFLISFSHLLYPALVGLLFAKSKGRKSWSLDSLCSAILDVKVNQKGMLDSNGKLLLQKIETNISSWMVSQQPLSEEEYDEMRKKALLLGLEEDTAYLYMQGHCVFNLIQRMGNFLCNGKSDFLYEVLIPSYTCNGYHEIDMVKSDIAQIL